MSINPSFFYLKKTIMKNIIIILFILLMQDSVIIKTEVYKEFDYFQSWILFWHDFEPKTLDYEDLDYYKQYNHYGFF